MQHFTITADSASNIIHVFIEDTRRDDGGGLTGLRPDSSGLQCFYMRSGQGQRYCPMMSSSGAGDGGPVPVVLVDTCAGDWTEGGLVAIDDEWMPGMYELQLPDACLTSGAHTCRVMLFDDGSNNMAITNIVISIQEVAAIADAVWDELMSEHTVSGSAARAIEILKKISVCRFNPSVHATRSGTQQQ